MPRQNDSTELYRRLTAIDFYTIQPTSPADTTTTGTTAAGVAVVPVTSAAGFTTGDPAFLIGDGGFELITAIGTPATSMPITNQKIAYGQSAGARFVEAVKVPLGKPAEQGFTFRPNRDADDIFSAVDDQAINFIDGPLTLAGEIALLGFNTPNWQLLLGQVAAETGAGTPADPYQAFIGGLANVPLTNICFRVSFLRMDAKVGHFDLLNCRIVVSGDVPMGRNTKPSYNVGVKFSQMIKRIST